MKYPIDTHTLPYFCGDGACSCHKGPAGPSARALAEPTETGWVVRIMVGGYVVDEFRGVTLNSTLEDVHREWAQASFNPEEA